MEQKIWAKNNTDKKWSKKIWAKNNTDKQNGAKNMGEKNISKKIRNLFYYIKIMKK